jgi:prevent-host-death family protein
LACRIIILYSTLRDVLITLTEARRTLGRVITRARITGEPVVITDRDEPVVTLIPMTAPQPETDPAAG